MFGSSLPPVVCRKAHILFTLLMLAYVNLCPTHIVLCFCFVFRRRVYPMLPVSLDCPFLIAPSVFSNFYIQHVKILHNKTKPHDRGIITSTIQAITSTIQARCLIIV